MAYPTVTSINECVTAAGARHIAVDHDFDAIKIGTGYKLSGGRDIEPQK